MLLHYTNSVHILTVFTHIKYVWNDRMSRSPYQATQLGIPSSVYVNFMCTAVKKATVFWISCPYWAHNPRALRNCKLCWDNCICLMRSSEFLHRLLIDKEFCMMLARSQQCGRLVFRVYMWCMFAFNDQQNCHFNCPLKSLPSNRAILDAIHVYVRHFLHVLWLKAAFYTRKFVYTLSHLQPFTAFQFFQDCCMNECDLVLMKNKILTLLT